MNNDLFEKAKQAVAERYQHEDWVTATAGRKSNGSAMGRLIAESAELYAQWVANEAVKALFIFRPVSEWHEDMGYCLFFQTPVCELPAITCPGSSCWIDDYYTHFLQLSRFPIPDEYGNPISGNYRYTEWLPFPQQPDGI